MKIKIRELGPLNETEKQWEVELEDSEVVEMMVQIMEAAQEVVDRDSERRFRHADKD